MDQPQLFAAVLMPFSAYPCYFVVFVAFSSSACCWNECKESPIRSTECLNAQLVIKLVVNDCVGTVER
jgi:hypothetical protein